MEKTVAEMKELEVIGREVLNHALILFQAKAQHIMPDWGRKNFLGSLIAIGLGLIHEEVGMCPHIFISLIDCASKNFVKAATAAGPDGRVELDTLFQGALDTLDSE